jgi:hypothetical protein
MAVLGLITFWLGIASWRRNAAAGLHRADPPPAPLHDD